MKRLSLSAALFLLLSMLSAENYLEIAGTGFIPSTAAGEHIEISSVFKTDFNFAENQSIDLKAGFNINGGFTGFTENIIYRPVQSLIDMDVFKLNIAAEQFFHWRYLYDVSNQLDFLIGPHFEFVFVDSWFFDISLYYIFKFCIISGMEKPFGINDGYFSVSLKKQFNQFFSAEASVTTFDFFYYPRFLVPVFSLGFEYKVCDQLYFFNKLKVRYVDMFTLSAYFETFQIVLGAGVKL